MMNIYRKEEIEVNINLQYNGVDYDYERTSCTGECGDDYCRCTRIYDTRVTSIKLQKVLEKFYEYYSYEKILGWNDKKSKPVNSLTEIIKYAINRICYINKIYDKDLYEVETCGGYYGEEIEGVYFTKEPEIIAVMEELKKCKTDYDIITFCLDMEYGYILDEIKYKSKVEILIVDKNDVVFNQETHYQKLDRDVVNQYKDFNLARCICVRKDDKFKLIDGCHRFSASADDEKIKIIVVE